MVVVSERTVSLQVVFYSSNKSQGTYAKSEECEIAQNWRASPETSFWELQQPGLSPPLRSQTFCPNGWQAGAPHPRHTPWGDVPSLSPRAELGGRAVPREKSQSTSTAGPTGKLRFSPNAPSVPSLPFVKDTWLQI